MSGIDLSGLSQMHRDLAKDFMDAADYLKMAITDIVTDTFAEDPPLVDFQARQKELESVAQKAAIRGWDKEQIRQEMTDLTGVRLICLHLSQIDDLVNLLHKLEKRSIIEIKEEARWVEEPQESGYRGVHLDVDIQLPRQRKQGVERIPVPCEIQVRTLIQHAWSERAHGLIHKPDYEPSEQIKNLFRIESLRLHGHQKTMDALWEMALWERKISETEESINPLTVKRLASEFGTNLNNREALNLYRAIKTNTTAGSIQELKEILVDHSIQAIIEEIYEAELRRQPDITGRLIWGSELYHNPDNGRFLVELSIISSTEFRGKESLPLNFNVIGRIDHTFDRFREQVGGWQTYHTHKYEGTVRGNFDNEGNPDGVEITATPEDSVFRVMYPAFPLAYPGKAIVADFTLEGNSRFHVLVATEQQEAIFFEFSYEHEETPKQEFLEDGTRYIRSRAKTVAGKPSISVNLPELAKSAGLQQKLHLIHGFYFGAKPRLILRTVEVYKNQLTGP